MADEIQDSTKIPNFNQEERDWLTLTLIGVKPRDVYNPFLDKFPRLAEYADEHGIPDDDLKTVILKRFHNINPRINRDFTEVMDNHRLLMERAREMRLEVAEASQNKNMSEKELKHLKKRLVILDKNLKMVDYLKKLVTNVIKFDMLTQKTGPKEDTDPIQPKQTQSPSDMDWQDDSRLERGEDK